MSLAVNLWPQSSVYSQIWVMVGEDASLLAFEVEDFQCVLLL